MKKLSLILLALLCSCGTSKLENIVTNNFDFEKHVIFLTTGEVTVPVTPIAKHSPEEWGGGRLNSTTYIMNNSFGKHIFQCQGCDSCLTAYDKKGLIKYKVLSEKDGMITANVELTSKGDKYRLDNTMKDNSEVNELKDKGIYLVIVKNQEVAETSNMVKESADIFNFDFSIYEKYTPFGEALGAKTKKDKEHSTPYEGRYQNGDFRYSRK